MLNTATQMRLAFSFLVLRGGKICIVDGAESLDDKTRNIMIEEAASAGVQLIMTVVGGDKLTVTSSTYEEAKNNA